MAHLVYWKFSKLPSEMVDILVRDLKQYDESLDKSTIRDDDLSSIDNKNLRNSRNCWIDSNLWIGGFIWYYIARSNRENFMYDITDIDSGTVQYTEYEKGEFYDWHCDDDIRSRMMKNKHISSAENQGETIAILNGEYVRKLSFSIQLSDPEDYEGGELEFKCPPTADTFYAPKDRGTIITFDSRVLHRVNPVKSGIRKSLVGWVVGPRWK